MRMVIVSFLMLSAVGCAAAPARPYRELFALERDRKLATIAERIMHFQAVSKSLGVAPESALAAAIVDLGLRHALTRAQLSQAQDQVGPDLEKTQDSVDAAIADLDVRSGQLALRLTFFTMN